MIDLIKEHKELFKNHIIDYLNDEISTKQQLKQSVESCDINYFNGSLDTLTELKNYIKEM
jgi:hypothetical protein